MPGGGVADSAAVEGRSGL